MAAVGGAGETMTSQAVFLNLIGPQALIAKQLNLWWRYELMPESLIDGEDSEDEGVAVSNSSSAVDERLIRKRQHSMPFLTRNLSNHPFQPVRKMKKRATRRTARLVPDETVDVISLCFGIGSPNISKRKRSRDGDSPGLISNIRRKITGWFSSPGSDVKKSPEHESMGAPSSAPSQDDVSLPSRPCTAYELYTQSSKVRELILRDIHPSLHHDEEFVINRVEAQWQEMTSGETTSKTKQSVKKDKDELNSTESSANERDITKHTYWVALEEKTRSRFREQISLQSNFKRRKLNPTKPSPVANTAISNCNQIANHPAYFHYIDINEDNHPCNVVEKRLDRTCPLCAYHGKSNEDLLKHCAIYHGVLKGFYPWKKLGCGFSFEAVLDEEKHLHIVVAKLGCSSDKPTACTSDDDFTFVRSESDNDIKCSIPFLVRSHQRAAAVDAVVRRKRLLALQSNNAPASAISSYLPTDQVPIRQYFHSRTNLPLEDWNSDDSDDEPDDEWLHKMSSDLISEFEDISGTEKKFMQMWNRFIRSHIVIADKDIPGKCKEFVSSHIKELKAGEMRNNLLLHLMNLWDSGVISRDLLLHLMDVWDSGDD